MRGRPAIVLVGVIACAERPEPQVPQRPLGAEHTAPPGTLPPDTQPPPLSEPPAEVTAFADRVRDISPEGRLDHAGIVAALRALDRALPVVDHTDPLARDRMRYAIERLETSPPSSDLHADYVRSALETAAEIAARGTPRARRDTEEYVAAVRRFAGRVRAIDPDRPLLAQQPAVIAALEGIARVLHAAVGFTSPLDHFQEAARRAN